MLCRRLLSWSVALGAALVFARAAHADGARLGRDVFPTTQTLRLIVDARKPEYTGTTSIAITVARPVATFQINAREIKIDSLSLTRGGGGAIPVTFANAPHEQIAITAASPIPAGAYTLEIGFSNRFDTRAKGLYRLETGGESYAFTLFWPDAARSAFPCFDEPAFKLSWRITLVIPETHLALANTPIEKESVANGLKTVVFQATKPLPAYLVAFAAGPLESVPVPSLPVPGRVVTVKGASGLAAEAVRQTPPILDALGKYFGRPYPYEKLDLIAVPEFLYGAMENPGAVTFADRALLIDPKAMGVQQRRSCAETIAHELSHMWFGDLVTIECWDDLWLSESFASWLGGKITNQVFPEFEEPVRELRGTRRAFVTDSRLSTHAMRAKVDVDVDLEQLLDELAYQKGEAVIGMFESWIGPETFRQGVVSYINAHQWGNAGAGDLWRALGAVAGQDVAGAMTTFLEQPGVPIVTAELGAAGAVTLTQRRFLADGGAAPSPVLWRIPVTFEFSDGARTYAQSVMLSEARQTFDLEPAVHVTWLHPNADERGYYRWSLAPGQLLALPESARGHLNARERVGFVGNLGALLGAGAVHGDQFLRALSGFGSDPQPEVVEAVIEQLEEVRLSFVTPALEEPFAGYVRITLEPALARIGVERREGESAPASALRPKLVEWLGIEGRDAALLRLGKDLAARFLADPASIDPAMAEIALELAARTGDSTLYDTFQKRFETSQTPVYRIRFLSALGHFRDARLIERTLAYALDGPLRPQELDTILAGIGQTEPDRDRVFQWFAVHYDALKAKLPPSFMVFAPAYASGCSRERLEAARAFFAKPGHAPVGLDRELAKVADQITECTTLRDREGGAVERYLTEATGASQEHGTASFPRSRGSRRASAQAPGSGSTR